MSEVRQCHQCNANHIFLPFTQGGYTGMMCGVCRTHTDIRPIPDYVAQPHPLPPRPIPATARDPYLMDYVRRADALPKAPVPPGEKPICTLTNLGAEGKNWCIHNVVSTALVKAGQRDRAIDFLRRAERLPAKEILKLAFEYVEVR